MVTPGHLGELLFFCDQFFVVYLMKSTEQKEQLDTTDSD